MRYYLDTEFDEGKTMLVSLGIVAQDGREFYAINADYNWRLAPAWLCEHVEPHLRDKSINTFFHGSETQIANSLTNFLALDNEDVRFFGYCSAWDIVLVHRLYGGYQGVLAAGSNVPLVCYDLKQVAKSVGIGSLKDVVKPLEPEHNALIDARWNKNVHEQIIFQYGREL